MLPLSRFRFGRFLAGLAPLALAGAAAVGEQRQTDLNLTATLHVRGLGSRPADFATRRHLAHRYVHDLRIDRRD